MNVKQKPEDFIGETFKDGRIKVVGILGKSKSGTIMYKFTCTECSKDPELFPDGYFVASKSDLKKGRSPCGCGNFHYSEEQQLLRLNRAVEGKFIIHGFVDNYKNSSSKVSCECPIHNHKWTPLIHNILKRHGCPKCGIIKSNESGNKSLDFIGWKSEDGKLEVIDVAPRLKYEVAQYKVTCEICSKDKELFPLGYFVSTKNNLIKGQVPCGCSTAPRWEDWQYLILLNRISPSRFKVHGFDGEFNGVSTKVRCECLIDGHIWSAGISPLLKGHGCPVCGKRESKEKRKIPAEEALNRCLEVCEKEGYESLGFPNGYINSYSLFEYNCKEHGKQSVTFSNFIKPRGTKCPYCTGNKKKPHDFIKDILYRCNKDNYIFVGFLKGYKNNTSKISYLCPDHGLTTQTYAGFMSGQGCNKCNKGVILSEQETSEICRSICEEMDYTFIGFPDGYKSNKSKFEYVCPEHGKQLIDYDSFTQGRRCKGCAKSGYDPYKKGSFYVVKWMKENDSFVKFGITNKKVKTRIKQQSSKTEYTPEFLFVATFEDGFIPLKIEKFIKKQDINRQVVSKKYFADGFTETISISDLELLENLIVYSLTQNIGESIE